MDVMPGAGRKVEVVGKGSTRRWTAAAVSSLPLGLGTYKFPWGFYVFTKCYKFLNEEKLFLFILH
jgi:hypothetical protein